MFQLRGISTSNALFIKILHICYLLFSTNLLDDTRFPFVGIDKVSFLCYTVLNEAGQRMQTRDPLFGIFPVSERFDFERVCAS